MHPHKKALERLNAAISNLALFMPAALRTLTLLAAAGLAAACTSVESDFSPRADLIGVPVSAVGHYGKMIGIPQFSINGYGGGNSTGWGGGGKSSCCVLLPRNPVKPVMVTVRWETYRSNVDEDRWHEATVPIHFAVAPGDSSGLKVHFFPGHKVEVWVTWEHPPSTKYPGPPYPQDPGPAYAPLPDEKPMPPAAGVR